MSAPDPNALGDTLKQAADAATPHPVDVDEVLRASRARRRSRRNAVVGGIGAAAVVLVIGGGVMAGLQGLGGRDGGRRADLARICRIRPPTRPMRAPPRTRRGRGS